MSGLKGIVDPSGNVHHFDHEYLEGNPTIPAVDSTLTQEGAAADAATVGEEISNLKEELKDINDVSSISDLWESGGLSKSGANATASNRIRTNYLPDGVDGVTPESGYKIAIATYDRVTGNFNGFWTGSGYTTSYTWFTNGIHLKDFKDTCQIRLVGGATTDADIDTTVATNFVFTSSKIVQIEETIENQEDHLSYFDFAVNNLHGLIDYNYGHKKTILPAFGDASTGTIVGVERYLTIVKLNLVDTSHVKRVRITGEIARNSANNTYKGWEGQLQLEEGHKYRAKIKQLSGTVVKDNTEYMLTLSVYDADNSNALISEEEYSSQTEGHYVFTAPSGKINIAIYIPSHTVITDAVYNVTLEEATDGAEVEPYYIEEMTDTLGKVRNLNDSPSLVFALVTDMHRYSADVQNFPQTIANMKYFAEQCPIDFILNLGDQTDGDKTQAITLQRSYDILAEFMGINVPYYFALGNHDTNYAISGHPYLFTMGECYKAYFTATERARFNFAENGTDYYIDFDEVGVRLIAINANNVTIASEYAFGATTAAWLTTALNTDRTVILAIHQSPIRDQVWNRTSTSDSTAVIEALQTFVNGGGNLIMLSGHSHVDVAYIEPWFSYSQVCEKFAQADIATSGYLSMTGYIDALDNPSRTQYTASEDAWSVCIFKPITNEFEIIRFGAGVDRHFHVTPIAPTTVTSKLSGTLTWSTSNDAVATVADGVITGVATGKCAIIAKDEDGNYECWIIEVQ